MRALLAVAVLCVSTAACVTTAMMERESLTAGTPALYAASPETVAAAARAALSADRFDVHGVDRPDTSTRVVLGSRAPGLFASGEWLRFAISGSARSAEVRVVSRSGSLLDVFHRDRAPLLLRALDERLDPNAVLVPGATVRLVDVTTRRAIIGELTHRSGDSLMLRRPGAGDTSLVLGELARAAVLRGRTGSAREFALVGMVVGGLIGFAIASANTSQDDWFRGLEQMSGASAGALVGLVAGGVLGAQVRTPMWSDVDVRGLRRP